MDRKKIITCGCIGILVATLVFGAIGASCFFFVFKVMKQSDVYRESLRQVRQYPEVIAELGEPIDDGLYVLGNININNNSGSADIRYPIEGPDGSATVHAVAYKSGSNWTFTTLTVELDDRLLTIEIK